MTCYFISQYLFTGLCPPNLQSIPTRISSYLKGGWTKMGPDLRIFVVLRNIFLALGGGQSIQSSHLLKIDAYQKRSICPGVALAENTVSLTSWRVSKMSVTRLLAQLFLAISSLLATFSFKKAISKEDGSEITPEIDFVSQFIRYTTITCSKEWFSILRIVTDIQSLSLVASNLAVICQLLWNRLFLLVNESRRF